MLSYGLVIHMSRKRALCHPRIRLFSQNDWKAMEQTLISVLIPVYNAQRFLEECLNSVLSQTYTNIEIVCVDDGSTDNSTQILHSYAKKDNRLRVFYQENRGIAYTRNRLLDESRGVYLAFVDADDKISPQYIAELYQTASKSRCDIVRALYYLQDINKNAITPCEKIYKEFLHSVPSSAYKERFRAALEDSQVWLKLIKSSLIKENHLSFLKGSLVEDISFEILLYLYAKKIVFLNKHLYFYRIGNEHSISSDKSLWARGTLENMIYLCNELEQRRFTASAIYNRQCALTLQAVRRLRKFPSRPEDPSLCTQAFLTVKEKSCYCSFWQKWKFRLFCILALRLPSSCLPYVAVLIR